MPDRTSEPQVLLVSHGWPTRGGISAFAESLAADPELRERFRLHFLNTTRTAERDSGRLRTSTVRWAVEDAWRTYRLARTAGVTHVHSALYPTLPLLRAVTLTAAARLAGSGVLLHVHGAEINSGRRAEFRPSAAYRLVARGLRRCTQVLTVAAAGVREVQRLAPGTPVAVLDNAVDVSAFEPATPTRPRARILYVGTLTARKGLPDLIAALTVLRAEGLDDWDLQVVGGGHDAGQAGADAIRRHAEAEGLGDALLGSLAPERVRELLREADLFVLPSYSEGLPIAVLEAMASGLPVVTTSVGAGGHAVRDGVDGFVVEPGDVPALAEALRRLLADPALRARMGRSARQRCEEWFDLPRLRRETAEWYLTTAGRLREAREPAGRLREAREPAGRLREAREPAGRVREAAQVHAGSRGEDAR